MNSHCLCHASPRAQNIDCWCALLGEFHVQRLESVEWMCTNKTQLAVPLSAPKEWVPDLVCCLREDLAETGVPNFPFAPPLQASRSLRRRGEEEAKKNLNCNKGFLHRQFFLFLRVFPLDEVFPRSPPWPCRTRRDLHSAWVSLRAPRELQGIQVPPTVRSSSKARSSEARHTNATPISAPVRSEHKSLF